MKRENTHCAECGMPVPDAAFFHPYLHCIIWKAVRLDPERVLRDQGYERVPMEAQP